MSTRGAIIVLDGMVGCGKTTQLKEITDELMRRGVQHFYGREPGGVPIAEAIRGVLLNPVHKDMNPLTTVFLFEAARAEYFSKAVIPKINEGVTVVTDRSYWSTVAFQGYGSGVDVQLINCYNGDAVFGHHPDISFILDVEHVEEAVRRALMASGKAGEADRFEDEARNFHTRVRDGYRAIPGLYPDRKVHLVPHFEEEADIPARMQKISSYILDKLGPFLDAFYTRE
ncbi:dTMP kinase [Candidatus Woesearchaeota archaeon]|nr:dTMP kinase [Candidatus Woesearchaeota archaeon]